MHQSIPPAPSSPGLLRGICPPCQSRGGAFASFALPGGQAFLNPGGGHSLAFDMHAVSYQNTTTQKVLLEKKADWLICQGQE